jgi:hypothetical protein
LYVFQLWRIQMPDRSILTHPALALAFSTMLMASAVPAFAADKGASAPTASSSQSTRDGAKKYCLSTADLGEPVVTGTILTQPKRQCLTRSQWQAKGVQFQVK